MALGLYKVAQAAITKQPKQMLKELDLGFERRITGTLKTVTENNKPALKPSKIPETRIGRIYEFASNLILMQHWVPV